jgi:hypothetical protein
MQRMTQQMQDMYNDLKQDMREIIRGLQTISVQISQLSNTVVSGFNMLESQIHKLESNAQERFKINMQMMNYMLNVNMTSFSDLESQISRLGESFEIQINSLRIDIASFENI